MHISELSAQMPEVHRCPFNACYAGRKSSIYCSHHQRSSMDPVSLTPVPTDGLNVSRRREKKKKQRYTVLGAQVFSKLSSLTLSESQRWGCAGPVCCSYGECHACSAGTGPSPACSASAPAGSVHCTPGCTELSGFWGGSTRMVCQRCLTDNSGELSR